MNFHYDSCKTRIRGPLNTLDHEQLLIFLAIGKAAVIRPITIY